MTDQAEPRVQDVLANLENELITRYGPLLSNNTLRIALGYTSMEAMRQAVVRGTIPVPVFTIPHRRGKHALTRDVAEWLAKSRAGAVNASRA